MCCALHSAACPACTRNRDEKAALPPNRALGSCAGFISLHNAHQCVDKLGRGKIRNAVARLGGQFHHVKAQDFAAGKGALHEGEAGPASPGRREPGCRWHE